MATLPHHSTTATTAAALMRRGLTRSEAAAAIGVVPSAVQAAPEHTSELSNDIDSLYDEVELQLLKQLKRVVPILMRPTEISRVLTSVNQAKRRGSAHPNESAPATVITLNLPTTIQNKFILNSSNQVVRTGAQDLVTLPSHKMKDMLNDSQDTTAQELGFTESSRPVAALAQATKEP